MIENCTATPAIPVVGYGSGNEKFRTTPSRLTKYLLIAALLFAAPYIAHSQTLDAHYLMSTATYEAEKTGTIKTIPSFDPFNCYSYVSWRLDKKLPPAKSLTADSPIAIGAIAIFYYAKSGLPHYAVVEYIDDDYFLISETNYDEGVTQMRKIPYDYPNLKGFTHPL